MTATARTATAGEDTNPGDPNENRPFDDLRCAIEHAAHLLPSQGPITVFVHHNTLHAFEDLPFEEGVKQGAATYGCHPYLPEERYRQELERGRIRVTDLEAVLLDDLEDEADRLVAIFGTRYALRLVMLQFPLQTAPPAELRWTIAETDTLQRFRREVDPAVSEQMIADTRRWVVRKSQITSGENETQSQAVLESLIHEFGNGPIESWSAQTWEAFVLHFLWTVCHDCVAGLSREDSTESLQHCRHRDALLDATGADTDVLVHNVLIQFCAAFLDQGFAAWTMPNREAGLYASFLEMFGQSFATPTRWLRGGRREIARLNDAEIGPLESIEESLSLLGVEQGERERFISQSLGALRGWTGMVWQMETNAEWMPHQAPAGSLIEFFAVRLILGRLATAHVMQDSLGFQGEVADLRQFVAQPASHRVGDSTDQRAFQVFQLAQVRGWKPEDLQQLTIAQWSTLVWEIESFDSLERREIFHSAYERKYRNETLDAVAIHSQRRSAYKSTSAPNYQVVCCIDEREESLRRHLEEIDSACETLGIAGFFGVAMYYRGAADAHFTPLCPVNIKPKHYVTEEPDYSLQQASRLRAEARRRIGRATHQAHIGTRTFIGGLLAGLLGSLAAFPLVARILFPRTTARLRWMLGRIVQPPSTQLRLERLADEPGPDNGQLGYSVEEMADIVEGGLRALGLARPERLSKLVVICGHGSASLNNPHEAAHDCGACGGGRGGPNARAFSQMANDARVRQLLKNRELAIPESVFFLGCYHNTCDDSITWYDLDRVPVAHRSLFESARAALEKARKRDAHERCRRFESSELSQSTDEALRHVEGRAEDLSQTRPEYGHASNSLCFVGRRDWSRGLFLDRRAFLTSYDPTQDDDRHSILERMLQAVVPVCAGINLEYYFSYVDPIGYGCGTNLPHNITSLLGVMDGAASDLRPGLLWQMVEIHEPVRLLFVIESTPATLQQIIQDNPAIAKLVNGDWVQLAVFDAETGALQRYRRGEFEPYKPESSDLPKVDSSIDWYHGQRDHLGFASINKESSNE